MRAIPTFLAAIVVLQGAFCTPVLGPLDKFKHYFTKVLSPHIIGGEDSPAPIPYQAALYIDRGTGGGFCGGVLIAHQWVLTAAHCVRPVNFNGKATVDVVLGAKDRLQKEASQQRIKSEQVIVHPGWKADPRYVSDDLALIKLQQPAKITSHVDFVRLPSDDQVQETFAQKPCLISGWGWDSDHAGSSVAKLQILETQIVSNNMCRQSFGAHIKDALVCTSGAGHRGACRGDSGGPMVIYEEDGKPTLLGIAAFVHSSSCERGHPTVYTRVTSYLNWILDTISDSK